MLITVGEETVTLSPTRQAIYDRLARQPWFQATDPGILFLLLTLPEDFEHGDDWTGLLADLADRPNRLALGGITHLRMLQFGRAKFGAQIVFEVRNDRGTIYPYEYFSWKHGPMSGAKGIVLVRTGDEITHFVILRGEKFAPAKICWDSIGGFADIGANGVAVIPDRIRLEVQEELGATDLQIEDVIDLGRLFMDPGMTNNHPGVFVVIIEAANATKINRRADNLDELELRSGAYVFPIGELANLIPTVDESFIMTAVLRCVNRGILPASCIVAAA